MVFRLRGYRFRYLILSIDWTREDLPMRPVDTVGTSCAIIAHADESAMKNRWDQWNEETYLGLKRELRTRPTPALSPRASPPVSSRAHSPASQPERLMASSPLSLRHLCSFYAGPIARPGAPGTGLAPGASAAPAPRT